MRLLGGNKSASADSSLSNQPSCATTPICRCRVLYLGSAVPHVTKDGLQGIQQPLRELYPSEGIAGAKGIDSWLSVWSNGLLLENVDEKQKRITRFFPIETLHYCAAVRYVIVPEASSALNEQSQNRQQQKAARFLPLDSPFARSPSAQHPPLFAAILRRTTGIKVLECHGFICKREQPTNALVRCCFHAYGDSMHARQMGGELYQSIYGSVRKGVRSGVGAVASGVAEDEREQDEDQAQIDVIERVEEWRVEPSTSGTSDSPSTSGGGGGGGGSASGTRDGSDTELALVGEELNHKVWTSSPITPDCLDRSTIFNDYENSYMNGGRNSALYGTGGRANRPRQRVMPAAPTPPPLPPPPVQQSYADGGRKVRKLRTRSERDSSSSPSRTLQRGFRSNGSSTNHTPPLIANGNGEINGYMYGNGHSNGHINGPSAYMNGYGSLSRPTSKMVNGNRNERGLSRNRLTRAMSTRPQPPVSMYPPQIVYGTLPPPPHVQMVPLPPMMPGYPPAMMTLPHPVRSRGVQEEPPYLPSATSASRPLSPIASYQPGHFPHEAYNNRQSQHFATMDNRRFRRNVSGPDANLARNRNKTDSPPSLGIYKQRRNHLNEKAFGFSIQQEQRSRSIGSLVDSNKVSDHDENSIRHLENGMRSMDMGINNGHPVANGRVSSVFNGDGAANVSTFTRLSQKGRKPDHQRSPSNPAAS